MLSITFHIKSVGSSVIALCLNHSSVALNQHVSVTNTIYFFVKSILLKELYAVVCNFMNNKILASG